MFEIPRIDCIFINFIAAAKRNQELNEQYQASRATMVDKFKKEMEKRDQVRLSESGEQLGIYSWYFLTLLHSEWPKLHRVLAILSATGLIILSAIRLV